MNLIILSRALLSVRTLMTLPVPAQDALKLEIADGLYDAGLKAKMEKSTSALLTEINKAFKENRALNLVSLGLTDTAERGLSALWENTHFYCDDSEVVQSCIRNGNGYQVRQIPLMIKPVGETLDDEYQEAVINYDASGNITRFNFTLSTTVNQNEMKKGKTVTEIARRQEILSYVEQFRTAYNEQDIQYLDNIFSEDALIITGSVTEVKKTDGNQCDIRIRVVRDALRILSDKAALMRSDRVDVTKQDNIPFRICGVNVGQTLLEHAFCPAVWVGRGSLRALLGDRNLCRIAVYGGRRTEDDVLCAKISKEIAQCQFK